MRSPAEKRISRDQQKGSNSIPPHQHTCPSTEAQNTTLPKQAQDITRCRKTNTLPHNTPPLKDININIQQNDRNSRTDNNTQPATLGKHHQPDT
jgi:hypothetical protein